MAKLNVLRSHSILSGKKSIARYTNEIKSYLEKIKSQIKALKANTNLFIPQMSVKLRVTKHDCLDPGTRPEEKAAPEFIHYEPVP